MSRIACVILNYNSQMLTTNLAMTISGFSSVDYVVVVDNNSNDGSKENLPKLEEKSDKIIVILEKNNQGYAKGNNRGAKYAIEQLLCDRIVIVNPDVTFSEDYIIKVVKLINSDPSIMIASAIAHDVDGNISYCSYWDLPTYSDYIRKFFPFLERRYQFRHLLKQKATEEKYVITEAVSGACFMAKKEVFQEIGGFDENTFLYCEESILGGKLKERGYRIGVVLTAFYNHNHIYKIENADHKINHYSIMLNSRRYYLSKIQNIGSFKLAIFDIFAKVASISRRIIWKASER